MPPLPWILATYALMGLLTFIAYAIDKRRAIRQARRISEATLHTLELCFGLAGAFLAQRLLHHKNRKGSYLIVFYAIALIHIGTWAWLLAAGHLRIR